MKKLVNRYSYEISYEKETDGEGHIRFTPHNSYLKAWYPNRSYATKKKVEDLPEYYCDVQRYAGYHDVISSKGVVDMYYTWVKENHFMKDSLLHISYSGKLEPYHDKFTFDGKEITSIFTSYTNDNELVFDDIFKFLAYAHKYSDYDLADIRKEFVKQCGWLEENEPEFAPELDDSVKTYGEWFDNKIKEYI